MIKSALQALKRVDTKAVGFIFQYKIHQSTVESILHEKNCMIIEYCVWLPRNTTDMFSIG